jgi:hypothetical protein
LGGKAVEPQKSVMIRRNIVSHDDKIIWVAVAKVASMAMQGAMTRKLGIPFNHWRRSSVESIEAIHKMDGYFRFAFVRDPWARLFSCYVDKIVGPTVRNGEQFILGRFGLKPGISFDRFVRAVAEIDDRDADQHFVSQFYLLSHDGRLAVDYVGRFERLPGDWNRLRPVWKLPDLPWTPVHTKRGRFDFDYHRPHYSPELIDIVRRRYADDIDNFGYEY